MAESSSHKSSSPEITPKEEPVTLDKSKRPNPFLPTTQVDFTFDEITFTTNNKVALIYPSHPNQEYFMVVSDFILKCYLKEAFTRALTQYKEYLSEFWYTTKTLEDFKVWVSTLTGGVRGEIGITTFRNALRAQYLPHSSKKSGAISGLRRKRSSKHTSESKTEASKSQTGQSKNETQSSLAKDKSPSHPSPPTLVDVMLQQIPQMKLIMEYLLLMIPYLHNKLEDLSDLVKDTRSAFFTPRSSQDEPIIVSDKSEEEESQKKEPEQQKAGAEAEVASLKARPSYPNINQLTNLLVTYLKPELSKLLASHDFASCLPTELKELPSKVTELSGEIKELKQFATVVENASGATTKDVPSVGQAFASPAEGEKNINDADTNLKNELIDLLGIDVVTQYYNKKLLYQKYCEKIKKRRKSSKIINCDVLTKKGPISLKVYKKDGTAEVIENFKVSDLHLAEWREVVQACPDRKEKGWKTIYERIKTH
ncbi:hypothetical protein Tco_1148522 [Tanacetum coccineum]